MLRVGRLPADRTNRSGEPARFRAGMRTRSTLASAAGCFGLSSAVLLGCSLLGSRPEAPNAPSESEAKERSGEQPLVRTLVPSALGGAEICFNATDDNQNRLIDEGCDIRQGDVHFMIAWPEPGLDVDLLVVDPSGSLAGTGAPSTLGLVLSDDCPRAGGACSGQAFESVHLDSEEIPAGTYHVRIVVQAGSRERLTRSLAVRFGARLPGVAVAREIEFSDNAREVTMAFSVQAEALVRSGP